LLQLRCTSADIDNFWLKCNGESKQPKDALLFPLQNRKKQKLFFFAQLALQDFNQSLVDFFSLTTCIHAAALLRESFAPWAVRGLYFGRKEVESLTFEQLDCFACTMCWCTVFLIDKNIIHHVLDSIYLHC